MCVCVCVCMCVCVRSKSLTVQPNYLKGRVVCTFGTLNGAMHYISQWINHKSGILYPGPVIQYSLAWPRIPKKITLMY